jgi:hypothetical protein
MKEKRETARAITEITPETNKFSVCDDQKTDWNFNYALSAAGFCGGALAGVSGAALSLIAPFFGGSTRVNQMSFILLLSSFGLLLAAAHYLDRIGEDKKASRRRRFENSLKNRVESA